MLAARRFIRWKLAMQIGDQSYVLGLFNTTSRTDSNGVIGMDLSSMLTQSGSSASATPSKPVAPTPPWNHGDTPVQHSANVLAALGGQPIVNESAAKLDLPGASADYRKLFALYHGLNTLMDIANKASGGV